MYLNQGGRILILLTESNQDDQSNVNILLEDLGIIPNMGELYKKIVFNYVYVYFFKF